MDLYENKFSFTLAKELNMYYCGKRIKTPRHSYGPEIRTHFLIVYIKEGHGTLFHKNGRVRLHPHSLLVMFPNERIHYKVDEDCLWSISWVGVFGHLVYDFFSALNITPENPVFHVENSHDIEKIMENIFDVSCDTSLNAKVLCISLVYEFFSRLLKGGKITGKTDYVKEAEAIIKYNFDKEISVQGIAESLHISSSHLTRLFKERLGCSPKEYLIKEKMERACYLLKNTDTSVKEIAISVGFHDQMYFSKLFKRKIGVSPLQYR